MCAGEKNPFHFISDILLQQIRAIHWEDIHTNIRHLELQNILESQMLLVVFYWIITPFLSWSRQRKMQVGNSTFPGQNKKLMMGHITNPLGNTFF